MATDKARQMRVVAGHERLDAAIQEQRPEREGEDGLLRRHAGIDGNERSFVGLLLFVSIGLEAFVFGLELEHEQRPGQHEDGGHHGQEKIGRPPAYLVDEHGPHDGKTAPPRPEQHCVMPKARPRFLSNQFSMRTVAATTKTKAPPMPYKTPEQVPLPHRGVRRHEGHGDAANDDRDAQHDVDVVLGKDACHERIGERRHEEVHRHVHGQRTKPDSQVLGHGRVEYAGGIHHEAQAHAWRKQHPTTIHHP